VPHDEAVDTMVRSDALLLVIPRGPFADGVITGKLFEYLASGRPILCLTPVDGEAARMVRAHGAGVVADIDDEREIYAGLRALYDDWKAGRPRRGADRDAIRGYDRAHLAGRLASLFDAVTAEAGDRPSEGSARPVGSLAEA
jgi:glycosyltransferase involved in cell wall biosynthesis